MLTDVLAPLQRHDLAPPIPRNPWAFRTWSVPPPPPPHLAWKTSKQQLQPLLDTRLSLSLSLRLRGLCRCSPLPRVPTLATHLCSTVLTLRTDNQEEPLTFSKYELWQRIQKHTNTTQGSCTTQESMSRAPGVQLLLFTKASKGFWLERSPGSTCTPTLQHSSDPEQ
ncbi:hypothetical protein H920_03337 [Fukomys damarensis]|uniref:Uncharacterized protein n=1 Tax=Fukomys damarensis TaxID=885580 RepID=A0A091DVW9_FUKDA|nr:hypothetical protein H920_03337 [Fukomys damarensis]